MQIMMINGSSFKVRNGKIVLKNLLKSLAQGNLSLVSINLMKLEIMKIFCDLDPILLRFEFSNND